jgi:hypothetical protein
MRLENATTLDHPMAAVMMRHVGVQVEPQAINRDSVVIGAGQQHQSVPERAEAFLLALGRTADHDVL